MEKKLPRSRLRTQLLHTEGSQPPVPPHGAATQETRVGAEAIRGTPGSSPGGLPPLEVQRSRKKEPGGGAAHAFPGSGQTRSFLLLADAPAELACPPQPGMRNRRDPAKGRSVPGPVTPATGRGRRAWERGSRRAGWRREGGPLGASRPRPAKPLQLQGRLRPGRLLTPSTPPLQMTPRSERN